MSPIFNLNDLELLTINIEEIEETNQTFKSIGFISPNDVIEIFIF